MRVNRLVSTYLQLKKHDARAGAARMFGIAIDLYDFKTALRVLFAAQTRAWMGAAFVATALFAIEYEEVVAPHLERVTHAWSTAAAKISAFSL
jgi:hypothetical protein